MTSIATLATVVLAAAPDAARIPPAALSADELGSVAPALERYREGALRDLWKRPGLSPRDRSLATAAVLITRNQISELPSYFALALDSGVKPAELSELITHLAFYAGWGNAMAAAAVAKDVFGKRGIGADQLPAAVIKPLPIDEAAEAQRKSRVEQDVGPVSPALVQSTGDVLFHDLWLRPDLAPRDRSLITVSALVASGQVAQITFHLHRAMDNGLTPLEVGELLNQLAFYAGWPFAMSAVPVARAVLEKRASKPLIPLSSFASQLSRDGAEKQTRPAMKPAPTLFAALLTALPLSSQAETPMKTPEMASQAIAEDKAQMVITRAGAQPPAKGPAAYFTGSVVVTPLFSPTEHTRTSAGSVSFEPGARSAWHTHPAGQTLIVTAGVGWVQEWGKQRHEIRPGDVVWTPPGVKHWHGAVATCPMTHIAVQENVNGKAVDWLEQVTDEQYRAPEGP